MTRSRASGSARRCPPPSPDQRIAAGVEVSEEAAGGRAVGRSDAVSSRSCARSTSPTAALRRWRWSAARSAARSRCRSSGTSPAPARRARACAGSCGPPTKRVSTGTRSRRPRTASTSCSYRRSSTGRAITGSSCTPSSADRVRVADPGRGLRRLSRGEVDEKWSRVVRDVPADASAGRRSGRAPGSRLGASPRAADASQARARDA